jgi:hypothetical protein
MGDEHGRKVLMPRYLCEEPSAAAGFDSLRPAAACRRGECRRLRGDLSGANLNGSLRSRAASIQAGAAGYSSPNRG